MVDLHYKLLGERKNEDQSPLVILHGLFGMLDNWQSLGRRFAAYNEVYLIDQRDHGRSPHTDTFDYFQLAEDLYDFLEEHDLRQIQLIGHSMGGKTAMQFAVDHPERIDKLIIADIAPKDYPPGHQEIFDGFNAVPIHEIKNRKEAEAALATKIDEEGVRLFLLKNLTRDKELGYKWRCNLPLLEASYPNIIANTLSPYDQYDGNVLFVKGGRSLRYIELPEDNDILEHHFPNHEVAIIENAGHWLHAEQADAFFDIVVNYLGYELTL